LTIDSSRSSEHKVHFHCVGACTINNMPDKHDQQGHEMSDSEKLSFLVTGVEALQKSQEGLKKLVESKIDRLRNELKVDIDTRVRGLSDEITLAIGRESSRIDKMLTTIQSLTSRVDTMEQSSRNAASARMDGMGTENAAAQDGQARDQGQGQGWYRVGRADDTELSVVVTGIQSEQGEDLMAKARDLIDVLGNEVSENVLITRVSRFKSRVPNRPGLVKITFRSIDEKILVLKNKMSLKDREGFQTVYIKSCKSHAERLIELNARTILRRMPDGNRYRVDANGRIQPKDRRNDDPENRQNGY